MEKSSAPFSLGGNNLKLSIRENTPFSNEPITTVHQAQKPFYWFIFKKGALPIFEIQFHSPPNVNGAELFPTIVHTL